MVRCDQCGFDYEALSLEEVSSELDRLSVGFVEVLTRSEPEERTRLRPEPDVWSALEYSCHVRDVFLAQRERILLALVEVHPLFVSMYREQRCVLDGYAAQNPHEVAAQLAMAGAMLTSLLSRLSVEQLGRTCVYNYPVPTDRNVAWVFQHTLHEAVHHFEDVRRELGAGAPPEVDSTT
jgi:DinB superfamily